VGVQPPYSILIAQSHVGDPSTVDIQFTLAPFTLIVQDVSCYANPDVVAQIFVKDAGTGRTFVYHNWTGPDSPNQFQWHGKQVFAFAEPPGVYLQVTVPDEPVDWRISGVLLTGVWAPRS